MTKLKATSSSGSNITFTFATPEGWTLKVDQSIAHNGTCLTVDSLTDKDYTVTAMDETLKRTNLGALKVGDMVNLERSMIAGTRLDGHIVQGHVDRTAECVGIENADGSTVLTFQYTVEPDDVKKGYVILGLLKKGDKVNLEFDILGKYIARMFPGMNENTKN